MVTTRTSSSSALVIEGLRWNEFRARWRREWQPGEHVALVGPTGCGKSTLAGHLLRDRRYVIATDPKGGDSTLAGLARYGFERVERWPLPSKYAEAIADGAPVRVIVGLPLRTATDRVKLRALLAKTFGGVFEQGGWTLYVDELQLAADRRLMGLSSLIEENLIAARDRRVSVVTSYQRPANVPRTASDQASWLFVWYTRDDDVVRRLAEMMGRPKDEVRAAMRGLGSLPHAVLVVGKDPSAPMLVTRPPAL